MKRQVVTSKHILILFTISALLILLGHSMTRANAHSVNNRIVDERSLDQIQLGFYDLMAEKQEIYDVRIKDIKPSSYTVSLTSPTDHNFILEGKIAIMNQNEKTCPHLNFTPVHYDNPQKNLMINSFVDYTSHHDFLIRDLDKNDSQLVVANTGMLILIPALFR